MIVCWRLHQTEFFFIFLAQMIHFLSTILYILMREKNDESPEEQKLLEAQRRTYMRNYYRKKRLQLLRGGRFIRRKAAATQIPLRISKLNKPVTIKFE